MWRRYERVSDCSRRPKLESTSSGLRVFEARLDLWFYLYIFFLFFFNWFLMNNMRSVEHLKNDSWKQDFLPIQVVTKDLLKPELSVMCYYRIENVALCCTALSSLPTVLQSLVQAAVRDVVALHNFSHVLLHRRKIGQKIQVGVYSVVCRWGIKVERVDM